MNKCDVCGKFRRYEDLKWDISPDYEDGSGCHSEDSYSICKICIKEEIEDQE